MVSREIKSEASKSEGRQTLSRQCPGTGQTEGRQAMCPEISKVKLKNDKAGRHIEGRQKAGRLKADRRQAD